MNLIKKIFSIFRGNGMYTLVVVDMQPCFQASQNQETIDRTKDLIRQAVKDGAPIVFLEYSGYDKEEGSTDSRLRATVEGYNQVHYKLKHHNDGSRQVKETVDEHGYPTDTIRVCGVNTNYCVRETVLGLKELKIAKKIEVSQKGTNCTFYHLQGLEKIKAYETVELID